MKLALVIVLYKTEISEIERLKTEAEKLNASIYLIDNTDNGCGYAEGINKGIKAAINDGCDVFVAANPDISIKCLDEKSIYGLMEKFSVGGFVMIQNGEKFYGGEIDKVRLSGGLISRRPTGKYNQVEFVSGSFMVISKEVVDSIGLFDTGFGMYYEDVDYCVRAAEAGFMVGVDSQIEYEHFEKSSTNPQKKFMLFKARVRFFRKHGHFKNFVYEITRLPLTIFEERQNIFHFLNKSAFFKNFLSLNISSITNKFLFFALFLFLTRSLSPKDYGLYTLVWAHIGIFSPLLDLGTTSYGIVHGNDTGKQKMAQLTSMRFVISSFVILLMVLSALVWGYRQQVIMYIALSSVIAISNAFSGSYLILATLDQKVYRANVLAVVFNFIFVFSLSVSLFLYRSLTLLFFLSSFYYAVYAYFNYIFVYKYLFPEKILTIPNLKIWRGILGKSYLYVLIGLFAGLYYKIDIFLLEKFVGSKDVGIYSAGYKFFDALLFVAASYNISATPILSKLKHNPLEFGRRIKRDVVYLFSLGLVISIFVYFIAPFVVGLLKQDYSDASRVLRIVIFALPLILFSSVIMNVLYVMGRSRWVMIMFAFQSFLNFVLNLIYIPKYSYIASSYITVISEFTNALFLIGIFYVFIFRRRFSTNDSG